MYVTFVFMFKKLDLQLPRFKLTAVVSLSLVILPILVCLTAQ